MGKLFYAIINFKKECNFKMRESIDICLLSYNRPETLKRTINSLFSNTVGSFNLTIVDNGSTDTDTIDFLKSLEKNKVKVIYNEKNLGLSRGVNQGLEQAKNKYIVRMDNDAVVLTKNWDNIFYNFMENHTEVGMVCPTTMKGINRGDYFEVKWALGFFFMFRKEIFDIIGGYCEKISHQQEADYAIRVRMAGWKVAAYDKVVLSHNHPNNPNENQIEKDKFLHRGCIEFEEKWGKYFIGKNYTYYSIPKMFFDDIPINRFFMRELVENDPELIKIWNEDVKHVKVNGYPHIVIPDIRESDCRYTGNSQDCYKAIREWAFSDSKLCFNDYFLKVKADKTKIGNVNPNHEGSVDIEGFVYSDSGNAMVARNLFHGLCKRYQVGIILSYSSLKDEIEDYEVSRHILPAQQSTSVIRVTRPYYGEGDGDPKFSWSKMTGTNKIGVLFWEYSGNLPETWIKEINSVDKVIIFGRFLIDILIKQGVPESKIKFIHGGTNIDIFKPEGEKKVLSNKRVKFLFVGAAQYRKGIDILYKAFQSAFKSTDDVSLYIKTMKDWKADIPEELKGYDITILEQDMISQEEMASIYRGCDYFIFPSRGEGLGLTPLEAAACGKPVIITDGLGLSAVSDYWKPEHCYLIKSHSVEINDYIGMKVLGHEADIEHLSYIMKQLYEKGDYENKTSICTKVVRDNFNMNQMAGELIASCLK